MTDEREGLGAGPGRGQEAHVPVTVTRPATDPFLSLQGPPVGEAVYPNSQEEKAASPGCVIWPSVC